MPDSEPAGGVSLREIISAERVAARVCEIADALQQEAAGRALTLVVITEGARRFSRWLGRELSARGAAPELVYVRARRTHGTRLEDPRIEALDPGRFEGRDVVVLDDIVDEGRTLRGVIELVAKGSPRSLRSAVLVSKTARRAVEVRVDHVGFEVADGWVVGAGMDLDGRYRELDAIAIAEPTDPRAP
jgi:hypoxanthine phosphoribosyltransferase